MRLWHKDLLSALPREQLVSQRRECSSIAGALEKKGTPNHILVNFVLDYDFDHFISYAAAVREEMTSRGYRTMNSVWDKITSLKPSWNQLPHEQIYSEKMNDEYLQICFWNLYEKYLCKGITEENFQKINNIIKERK
jgi:uncharacterized protein (TIGR02328 family)